MADNSKVSARIGQFSLKRDEYGYAAAIAVGERVLIHLKRGTVKNEENAKKMIAALNAAVAVVNNVGWAGVCDEDVRLEQALLDIR